MGGKTTNLCLKNQDKNYGFPLLNFLHLLHLLIIFFFFYYSQGRQDKLGEIQRGSGSFQQITLKFSSRVKRTKLTALFNGKQQTYTRVNITQWVFEP